MDGVPSCYVRSRYRLCKCHPYQQRAARNVRDDIYNEYFQRILQNPAHTNTINLKTELSINKMESHCGKYIIKSVQVVITYTTVITIPLYACGVASVSYTNKLRIAVILCHIYRIIRDLI